MPEEVQTEQQGQAEESSEQEAPPTPSAEEVAQELGFKSVEALRKKGKGLRKWEAEVNNRHQAAQRQPVPTVPTTPPSKDNPLEGVSPKVIEAIKAIVREEVGPDLQKVQQDKANEMSGVVEDFLDDHPDISQQELFETMTTEELWPGEDQVNKRLLKRRLNAAYKLMNEASPDDLEAKIRRQIMEEMREAGGKVVDIQPKRKTEKTSKTEKPKTWVDRMQEELNA